MAAISRSSFSSQENIPPNPRIFSQDFKERVNLMKKFLTVVRPELISEWSATLTQGSVYQEFEAWRAQRVVTKETAVSRDLPVTCSTSEPDDLLCHEEI